MKTIRECTKNEFCYYCCIQSKCMNLTNCDNFADSREKTARVYVLIVSLILFLTVGFLLFYVVVVQSSHNKFLKVIENKEIEKSMHRSNFYNSENENERDRASRAERKK